MVKISTLLLFIILASTQLPQKTRKEKLDRPTGQEISIEWNLVTNNYKDKPLFKSILSITNHGNQKLDNKNWELYFTHSVCRKILSDSLPNTIKITRLAGDYYKITPTKNFPKLGESQTYSFPIISTDFVIKYSDAPSGFYFIFFDKNGKATKPEEVVNYKLGEINNPLQIQRGKGEGYDVVTPKLRYQQNSEISLLPSDRIPAIIPTPLKTNYTEDTIYISKEFIINHEHGLENEAHYLQSSLKTNLGIDLTTVSSTDVKQKSINLFIKPLAFTSSSESYILEITKDDKINITGNSASGVFYGVQSLRALIPTHYYNTSKSRIPLRCLTIEDTPKYPYRGMLLDIARNFTDKETLLKLLDILSFYKINKFQLHLADDEGWRLEIKDLPELTQISSKRGHTKNESERLYPAYGSGAEGTSSISNGYYSREDFIEILKYAKERHIEIIPAIDLPGHARAAINAMNWRYQNQLKDNNKDANTFLLSDPKDQSVYLSVQQFNDNVICPCNNGVYNFIQTIISNLDDMYEEAGLSISNLHLGGDEVPEGVWQKSPACKQFMSQHQLNSVEDLKKYFLEKCVEITHKKKIILSIYEDGLLYKDHSGKRQIRTELTNKNLVAYSWNNVWGEGNEDIAYKLANESFPVVLMHVTNLYLDHAYTNEPDEPGFYWGGGFIDTKKIFEYTPDNIYNSAYIDKMGHDISTSYLINKTRLTEKGKKNILGIQGALFSETLTKKGMTEYYTFPKVIALAERAWAQTPEWAKIEDPIKRIPLYNKEWNVFANQLGQIELPRLDYLQGGINYQLPSPGILALDNQIKINSPFPGLIIRYTLDGADPTENSSIYLNPISNSKEIKAALFSPKGKRGKIASLKNP